MPSGAGQEEGQERAVYDTLSPCQSALVGKERGRLQVGGAGGGALPGRAAILAAGNLGHWLTPLFGQPAVAFAPLFLG